MKFAGANAKLGKSKIHNVTILNANHKKEKEIKRELDLLHGVSDVYNYQSKIDKKKFFNEIEKAMGIERLDYDF
ncbi:MAG: hypothetical protein HYV29_01590 [Ignavibacteriales bacterium]|nr:hypothetical protein [Ignavibacteriales bacterium]